MMLLLLLCLPVANSQGIDCHVGDTVMLPCDGPAATDTKEVHVTWMFGGRLVCWFEDGSWCETGHYVNQTLLGSIRQNNFSLVINHVRKEDDGVYMCRISGEDLQSIRLNVKGDGKREDAETPPRDPVCRPYREREDRPGPETKDKQDPDENPPGASSGGSLAVGLGLAVGIVAVAVLVAAVLFRRQKNQLRTRRPDDPIQSTAYSPIVTVTFIHVNQRTEEPANEGLADPIPSTADGLLSGVSGHFGGCSVNQRTTARTRLGL